MSRRERGGFDMKLKVLKNIGAVLLVSILLSIPVVAAARGLNDYPLTCPRCGGTTGDYYTQVSGTANGWCHSTRCSNCGTAYLQRHWGTPGANCTRCRATINYFN